jgi:hypothetical protein
MKLLSSATFCSKLSLKKPSTFFEACVAALAQAMYSSGVSVPTVFELSMPSLVLRVARTATQRALASSALLGSTSTALLSEVHTVVLTGTAIISTPVRFAVAEHACGEQ